MGSDARNDVFSHASRAVLGVGGQRAGSVERRLAQSARRRDTAFHDGGGRLPWAGHFRRVVHGNSPGELAVALYRLDG